MKRLSHPITVELPNTNSIKLKLWLNSTSNMMISMTRSKEDKVAGKVVGVLAVMVAPRTSIEHI